MKKYFLNSFLVSVILFFNLASLAEDIDLFVSAPSAGTDLPNLMIVLDNAANFSASASDSDSTCNIGGAINSLHGTAGGIQQCAIHQVIQALAPLDSDPDNAVLNLGFMVYNANGIRDINHTNCGGSGAEGGCLMVPLRPLTKANKTAILSWITTWRTSGGAGNGFISANTQRTAAAMHETWAYYAGRTGYSGRSYAEIRPADGCQKNFVVFVGNAYNNSGSPGDDNAVLNPLFGTSSNATMNVSPPADASQRALIVNSKSTSCGTHIFVANNHANRGWGADEYARYMASQNITTYSVGVLGPDCRAEYAALLSNMADVGGGKYYPTTNYDGLVTAFRSVLSQIQSVNSVFASVSLPVSVNTQGTYLNQVYVGMFRPDKDAKPRWFGNLKQYKFGLVNDQLELVDAENKSAISAGGSGFVSECATSFWTRDTSNPPYWVNNTKENCIGNLAASDFRDGNLVEKGGQAQMLRNMTESDRNIQTCSHSACASLASFDHANASIVIPKTTVVNGAEVIQNTTGTERTNIINWLRGLNNQTEDNTDNFRPATAIRPSVHGDVVHSRPVAIDFPGEGVIVFYGGNDGVFRAVNGEQAGAEAGRELWSFVPTEFYSKIYRIYKNEQTISFPGFVTASAFTPKPKDYAMDGPVTAMIENNRAYIFASMRRGGDAVYAFDFTSSRTSPVLKWKFRTVDGAQTWSSAKPLKSKGYSNPIVMMGGGYDPVCHDPDVGCQSTTVGNKVYMVDAETGHEIVNESFTDGSIITNSIMADITVVPDSTNPEFAAYAYAADLGGNIYRISGRDANAPFGATAPQDWTITKIAALGGTGINRKFMFAPDVVNENGTYILLLGSGDREKPIAFYAGAATVENRFYAIKDKPSDPNWLNTEIEVCGSPVICDKDSGSLFPIFTDATPTDAQLSTKEKGWYLALSPQEQVVTSAITVFGTTTFSTHKPFGSQDERCRPALGTSSVYNINYRNAAPASDLLVRGVEIVGGGLPPSPVAGVVDLGDGTQVPFLIGSNPQSALQGSKPYTPPTVARPKSRVYWNIRK